MSSCDCHIEVTDSSQKKILLALLVLNATMFVAELVVGIIGESTGVLADSLDMLADAFLSGGLQILIALGIFADIIRRAITGSEPSSLLMFIISIVALTVNTYCLKLISKEKEGEVHMRASYIFSKNDVIANSGVILASLLIYLTGSRWPDLVIGTIITIVVFRGGLQILKDAQKEGQSKPLEGDGLDSYFKIDFQSLDFFLKGSFVTPIR